MAQVDGQNAYRLPCSSRLSECIGRHPRCGLRKGNGVRDGPDRCFLAGSGLTGFRQRCRIAGGSRRMPGSSIPSRNRSLTTCATWLPPFERAFITLVDEDRSFWKSCVGVDLQQTGGA